MVAFVILHYKSIEETLKCLDCLKKTFNKKDYKTIVVDNNTLTEEDENKIKEYTKDILLLDQNYGFAKANNKGCIYAKEKYNPDFIVVINNDVYIEQKEFIEIIKDDYEKYHFDMLGPWIDSTTKESCNPFPVIYGKENVLNAIRKCNRLICIYKSLLLSFLLRNYIKIKHIIKKPVIPSNGKSLKKDVALHGCAIIFSKKYLDKYDDVFYNETFLFHEEEFLYLRIKQDKLKSIYDPNLKVFHKEGSSLSKQNKNVKLFKEQEKKKSLELLLKQM